MNLSQKLRLVSLDKKQWQRLYYKNQQAYIAILSDFLYL